MSDIWAKNPDLFLYTKGNEVYVWRCNKTTWVPMVSQDFYVVAQITDHQALFGDDSLFNWDRKYYQDLVAYISPRRLLVNNRGLVIAELSKFDQDDKLDQNDQQPFYMRSFDVISLHLYNLRDRTIPSRTVRYLGSEGKTAPVEDSAAPGKNTTTTSTTTTTSSDDQKKKWDEKREALEKQVADLITANKTLKSEKDAAEKQASDLNDRNKTLSEDIATEKTAAEKAEQERDDVKKDKEAAERKAVDLQTQIDTMSKKEIWMNDHETDSSNWVGLERLVNNTAASNAINVHIESRGFSFVMEGNNYGTNIRGRYLYQLKLNNSPFEYMGTPIEDLVPNKEKARFNGEWWWYVQQPNGTTYVCCQIQKGMAVVRDQTYQSLSQQDWIKGVEVTPGV